ncbi:MAG: hypothetical protein AB7U62_04065 [Pseudolabrys sp.]
MSARTILTLANGKGANLVAPTAADIDFEVIAEHLAKVKRYNGATPDREYSVAEHTVRGCGAILADTGDKTLAAYFALHDAPEHALGDDTTPKKCAIAEIAEQKFGILSGAIMQAFQEQTDRFDAAIHEAAGLPWPMPPEIARAVKHYDLVMFVTEWRDLMPGFVHPAWDDYRDIAPLPSVIEPWTWPAAKLALWSSFRALLPALAASEVA